MESTSENIIRMHPDFRMIVLANRPGFPFLGNDFFAAVGQYANIKLSPNDNPWLELNSKLNSLLGLGVCQCVGLWHIIFYSSMAIILACWHSYKTFLNLLDSPCSGLWKTATTFCGGNVWNKCWCYKSLPEFLSSTLVFKFDRQNPKYHLSIIIVLCLLQRAQG